MKEYKSTGGVYEEGYQRCAMPARKMSKNEFFEKNGYLFIPGLIADPENLKVPVPEERGQITYYRNRMDKYDYSPDEKQVNGSLARYNIPIYRDLHFLVKKQIERETGYLRSEKLIMDTDSESANKGETDIEDIDSYLVNDVLTSKQPGRNINISDLLKN